MPIHPENAGRYPADWSAIAMRAKERAGWRCACEGECGREHVGRCTNYEGATLYKIERHELAPTGRVVLTTAHLDHTPENCGDDNLRAMCQGCHLHYDLDHHRESRLRREREARAAAGQMEL